MPINKILNEKELEKAYGGPIKTTDLPSKFKTTKKDEKELSENTLENVYGGPIKTEDLPEDYYVKKDDTLNR